MSDSETINNLAVDQTSSSNSIKLRLPGRRLDATLIIGLSAGACLIVTALVLSGSLSAFYNIPAILLVFLGTLAVTMISFNFSDLISTLSEFIELLAPKHQ